MLILASQSPRRRKLMADAGYEFQVIPPAEGVECGICTQETPPEMVARLAMQKAKHIAMQQQAGLIIGCDTVAECCGQILGKPTDRDHAEQMLKLLSGREHRVYSGLCLWRRPDDYVVGDVVATTLVMDELEDGPLQDYLDSEAWQGKAGAFGFQDGLDWLHLVEGSESNVVGLPMERLAELLVEAGYDESK